MKRGRYDFLIEDPAASRFVIALELLNYYLYVLFLTTSNI